MANELKFSVTSISNKNGFAEGTTNSCTLTQTGKTNISANQTLSSTAEALDAGEALAPFWLKVINLDATASVTVGTDATAVAKPLGQLPAASGANYPFFLTHVPTGATVYAVASTGTPVIHFEIFPD